MTNPDDVIYSVEYVDDNTLVMRASGDEFAVLRDSTRATTAEFIAWIAEHVLANENFQAGYGPVEEEQTREELIQLIKDRSMK